MKPSCPVINNWATHHSPFLLMVRRSVSCLQLRTINNIFHCCSTAEGQGFTHSCKTLSLSPFLKGRSLSLVDLKSCKATYVMSSKKKSTRRERSVVITVTFNTCNACLTLTNNLIVSKNKWAEQINWDFNLFSYCKYIGSGLQALQWKG